jgi:hypothetical protein
MAAIVGKLHDSLRHSFHIGCNTIVSAAGGDHSRGPEVYETTEGLINQAFNEIVAAGRIEGVFEKKELSEL